MLEEYHLFRRIAVLFDVRSSPEDINAAVEEANAWISRTIRPNESSEDHPLRTAATALHQYRAISIEKDETKKELQKLRHAHQRHVTVKNKDIKMAMLVEKGILEENKKTEEEINALRAENARLRDELSRYTRPSNPLPRPPQLLPSVSNFTRQRADPWSGNQRADDIPGPPPPVVVGGSIPARHMLTPPPPPPRAVQVIHPPPAPGTHSKYKVTSNGEQLRQENRRRPHLIVPGAVPDARVLPLYPDTDATPRAAASVPFYTDLGIGPWAGADWPYDFPDQRPPVGGDITYSTAYRVHSATRNQWIYQADAAEPKPLTPEAPLEQLAPAAGPPPPPQAPPTTETNGLPPMPAAKVPSAHAPHMTRSGRVTVDNPDMPLPTSSMWQVHPPKECKPGQVLAFDPKKGYIPVDAKHAGKMPVRARGTQSRRAYVVAKEPGEVDGPNSHSPGPNPLQLMGVPEEFIVGSSTGEIAQDDEDDALFSTARDVQNQPDASGRTGRGHNAGLHDPSAPLGSARSGAAGLASVTQRGTSDYLGLGIGAQPGPGQSVTARPAVQNQVVAETLPQPSPASSWGGTYQPSRRSSLSLHIANLPTPQGIPTASQSTDQVQVGEYFGGPISVDVVTENTSISIRAEGSRDRNTGGLLMSTGSAGGSSRQVVTGLQDLEEVNRSLLQLAEPSQNDARSTRSTGSSRHSRQTSFSGREAMHNGDAHIGPRTGIALYGSRPATHYSGGGHPSSDYAPANPSPPVHSQAQARAQSRASVRSRADSTHSHNMNIHTTHGNSSSSHRPSEHRARRSSTASSLHLRDGLEVPLSSSWGALEASDSTQAAYTSQGPYAEPRPHQGSHESIPRSLASLEGLAGGAGGGGLLLSFEAPSTSAAVDRNGEAAAGIHAPRPVSSRHSTRSLFNGAWSARSGH
ncbi:hypothetical protein C8Q77DRAFT_1106358 [Trametes polyzona]|nr:hypothetical protein C8Q77DRAFT_1106358 [Trametes polyzona]